MVTMDPDPLSPSVADSPLAAAAAPVFIGCCLEELVDVELEALRQGQARARADGAQALRGLQAISEAAAAACERALVEQYVALDEAKFRDVFTLSWCAGYREEIGKSPRG